ncbi:chondroitin sulfate proteoglycan 5b isoform X2 [Osmerus eperlanus]|uniref:chondroitin sulfate proteoglycan 5b isoform X2 n=1 Tax=Osmerus eperlanus TaxID=29151 RepID=UPI002E10A874
MAVHGCNRSGIRQVLLHIFMLLIPLTAAHGHSSLASARRQNHHFNQSSVAVAREGRGDRTVLSDDSAERDLLIGAGIGLGAGLPLSTVNRHPSHKHAHLDFPEEETITEELTAGGGSPDQPAHFSSDDIITVEFHSPAPDTSMASDLYPDWMKPPKPLQQKSGDPTAWTLSDFYEYLSPDDDLSALDTTPNPEPSPSPPPDMEDENPLLVGSPVVPDNTEPNSNAQPTQPPPVVLVGQGSGMEEREGPDGCSLGFVRSEMGTCLSQCDSQPNFCNNGGVCTAVAGIGAFCRCNVQDYIWNKGLRCDWVITEFQVLCVVVGVASLMLLLLLMIIVFFAKRLHLLKKENKRLRKRSKYRPHSEPQTDGFSVSTVTDGSHPNDDPQKLEDPVKSPPPVEEENLNIRNSHSPKHENNRPTSVVDHGHGPTPNNTEEAPEDGVTIGLQLLLPKDAKLRPEASPPLQYNVFLYKLPGNGDSTQNGNSASTRPSPPTPLPHAPPPPTPPPHAPPPPPTTPHAPTTSPTTTLAHIHTTPLPNPIVAIPPPTTTLPPAALLHVVITAPFIAMIPSPPHPPPLHCGS